MKNILARINGWVLLAALIPCVPATAAPAETRGSKAVVLKSLAINRSMLARFEAEFAALTKEGVEPSSGLAHQQLTNIQYKINALDEENQKLTRVLPETMQANEFLKDMLVKTEPRNPSPVNPLNREATPQFSIEEASLPAPTEPAKNFQEATPMRPLERTQAAQVDEAANPKTFKLHERALEFVAKKELKKAIKLYEEIVLSDPNDDEAYLIMGHCFVLTGVYEKAEEAFQNAVHINAVNVNQISPFYENLALQAPDDPDVYTHLGFVCLMLGNLKRANEAFKEALSLNPQDLDAIRGMRILEDHSH